MDDFKKVIEEYNSESHKSREIIALVEKIYNTKQLRFKASEIKDEFPLLISLGILHKDGFVTNDIDMGIKDDLIVYYALFEKFSELFSFTISTDLKDILNFCERIGEYFEGAKSGVKLKRGLLQFLVKYLVLYKKDDLQQLARSFLLEPVNPDFYWLFETYFELIRSMDLPNRNVWEMSKCYVKKTGPPKPDTLDLNWEKTYQFWQEYLNEGNQLEFKSLAMRDADDSSCEILCMFVLDILLKKEYVSIEELISFMDGSNWTERALRLLSSRTIKENDLMKEVLDRIEMLSNDELKDTQALRVLINIFSEASLTSDKSLISRCKAFIESIIEGANFDLVTKVIYALSDANNNDEYIHRLLVKTLHSKTFEYRVLNFYRFFFLKKNNLESLVSFLKEYAIVHAETKEILQSFGPVLSHFKTEKGKEFEREILLMVIDDFGEIRKLGHKIFFSHEVFYQGHRIVFDFLEFDFLQQYKLTISLLIKICPISETIPLISNLLRSKSGIIRELVLTKLEELIVDFKNEVIILLKENMDDSFPHPNEVIDRLELKLNEVVLNNTTKSKIKEFDPTVSDSYQMRKYLEGYFKKTQEQVSQAKTNYGGIFQVAKNVKVARGGGMVMPDGTIQPLFRASASFTIPSTMYLTPEVLDYEINEFFSENWKTEFEKWEQIILSSGNI